MWNFTKNKLPVRNNRPMLCVTFDNTYVIGEWNVYEEIWYIPNPCDYTDGDRWGNDIIEKWIDLPD